MWGDIIVLFCTILLALILVCAAIVGIASTKWPWWVQVPLFALSIVAIGSGTAVLLVFLRVI